MGKRRRRRKRGTYRNQEAKESLVGKPGLVGWVAPEGSLGEGVPQLGDCAPFCFWGGGGGGVAVGGRSELLAGLSLGGLGGVGLRTARLSLSVGGWVGGWNGPSGVGVFKRKWRRGTTITAVVPESTRLSSST